MLPAPRGDGSVAMLIKEADDQATQLAEVQKRAQGAGVDAKRAVVELRNRRAGVRGEQQAAYLIDFDYAASPNWAVIHDLRLEHGGRVAQIDHLLINRWMDVYVLETKSFHAGVKITEEGEFLRWNNYRKTYEGMASPIEQNERHVQVLRASMKSIQMPTRLGLRIPPAFQSFVLVSSTAKVYRPKRFDASRVIKADQLKKSIWRDIDNENGMLSLLKTAKIVSSETLEYVARQLAALHAPLRPSSPGIRDTPITPATSTTTRPPRIAGRERVEPVLSRAPAPPAEPQAQRIAEPVEAGHSTPAAASALRTCECKVCQSSQGNILSGKYGYYFKCRDCSTNTAIRFTCEPGHTPRLRGERGAFYRDCAQCGSSELFHCNVVADTR
ncbi:NERD domain-containing protein [Lysobacter sp. F6437]|uniref:NERD domain-containing protein n=1 Tax=Lysobacter sp. F6437 TaxID=3459296 RepID=UPI00403DE1A6